MGKGKRSFFERLTGTVSIDDYDDVFEEEEEGQYVAESREPVREAGKKNISLRRKPKAEVASQPVPEETQQQLDEDWVEEEGGEGQLSVDVYQTPDDIVIRAHVAGVRPDELDISITRDMVTVKGKREESQEVGGDDYFYKELYWGAFSRTILLPQEIEVEGAVATEKHGLLILRLPKIDKERQTKLKVKAG